MLVPVGTEEFHLRFVQDMMRAEPAALLGARVPIEDSKVDSQIPRLSAVQ